MPAEAAAEAAVRSLARLIERWGQSVSLVHDGQTFTPLARVTTMALGLRYVWFRSTETDNWESPAYTVTLPGDYQTGNGGPAVGDSVTLYGQTYTVRKIDRPRVGTVVIKTVLLAARDITI